MRSHAIGAAACALALVASLTACGGSGSDVKQGSTGQELKGVSLRVGSKEFTEQLVLGQMTLELLRAHGANVTDKTNIQGSTNTRNALTSGRIDLYWDYTGTGWITYLKHAKPIPDPKAQYDAVAKDDLAKNDIVWEPPAPLNNTYAFAIRQSAAQQLGVRTMSDVANLLKTKPSEATFCIESEFSTRDDGWPGLKKAYGMNVPSGNVKQLDTGVIYSETAKGSTCNFGEVFTTDGRIPAKHLLVLQDDKHFFPVYNASLTLRKQIADKYPQIAKIVAPVAQKLTDETMRGLNAKVDVDGYEPKQVAHDWLKQQGFIK
jgi:osmoprotectant transport system substrate-binding protein